MQKVNRIRNVANAHYLLVNKTFSMSWTLKFVEKFQLDWNLYKGDMPTQTIKDKFNLWVLKIVLHWIKFESAPQCASIRFRFRRLNSKWQNFRALARTEVQNLYKQFNRTSVSQNFPLTFQFNRLLDESQKMLKANGYISRLFSPVKWLAKSKSEVLSRQLLGQEVSTTEIQYFARVYTAILDLAGPNFTWEFFPLFCYQVKPENQFQFPKKKTGNWWMHRISIWRCLISIRMTRCLWRYAHRWKSNAKAVKCLKRMWSFHLSFVWLRSWRLKRERLKTKRNDKGAKKSLWTSPALTVFEYFPVIQFLSV